MTLTSIFKRRKNIIVFSVLFTALIFSVSAYASDDEIVISRDKYSNYEKLEQEVSIRGSVRVIVKLDVPGIKELTAESNRFRSRGERHVSSWSGAKADMTLKEAVASAAHAVLDRMNGTQYRVNHIYSNIPYMALRVSEDSLAILASLPEVLHIETDKINMLHNPVEPRQEKSGSTSDSTGISRPMLGSSTTLIGADNAWGMGYTGSGWNVVVVDTGIRTTHEFFNGKSILELCFAQGEDGTGDCPNGGTFMTGPGAAAHHPDTFATYDHGTHVAGIAAGDGSSLSGVARGADIIAIQVFSQIADCNSSTPGDQPCLASYDSDMVAALANVYNLRGTYNVASVNMSIYNGGYSSPCDGDSRKAVIDNLWAVGIPTVICTGNSSLCGSVGSPACISTSVAVGASDDADNRAGFSNWHETMQKLFAPGDTIYSATGDSDTSYGNMSGTSMAAPHVAGAFALLRQAKPSGTVTDFLSALRGTGVGITANCDNHTIPIPRIQVDDAITVNGTTLTTPNNGESWEHGSTKVITWYPGSITGSVKLVLRRLDGSYVGLIDYNIPADACSYTWQEVGTLQGGTAAFGTDYIIRVRDMNSTILDDSDVPFTITGIKVKTPNAPGSISLGSNYEITWDAGQFTGNVDIILRQNNSALGVIKNIDPGLGSWTWNTRLPLNNGLPVTAGTGYVVRVKQVSTPNYKDDSDNSFSIGEIEVTSPGADTKWEIDCTERITWNAEAVSNNVKIVLWKDGNYVSIIEDNIPATKGFHDWTVGHLKNGTIVSSGDGYVIKVREEGGATFLTQDNSDALTLVKQFSYTPMYLPGTIEAENYDVGGESVSYHDTTPGNIANPPRYRFDDVDIQLCYDTGGGYNVGWIDAGEWLEYTVDVAVSGYYDFEVRVAASQNAAFSIYTVVPCSPTLIPLIGYREFLATGGSQVWKTVTIPRVFLSAGTRILRFTADQSNFNLNKITVSPSDQSPYGGITRTIPGTIQAEDYDTGGEGYAYHDTTSGNICYYQAYRFEDVDVENSPVSGPTLVNVGYIDTNEWLEYTVDITQAGYYTIVSRAAAPTGGAFSIEIDGAAVTQVNIPASGLGAQDYASITVPMVYLPKGKAILKINMLQALWNFDYIQFIKQ